MVGRNKIIECINFLLFGCLLVAARNIQDLQRKGDITHSLSRQSNENDQQPIITFRDNEANSHEYHPKFESNNTLKISSIPNNPVYTMHANNFAVSTAYQKFSDKLYQILAPENANTNLVYSPLSLQTILTLLYFGSTGATFNQLQHALGLPKSTSNTDVAILFQTELSKLLISNKDFQVIFASKIYYNNKLAIHPQFEYIANKSGFTELEPSSFTRNLAHDTVKYINQWIALKTNNHINKIITQDSIDDQTQAILVNTIYMKAKWAIEFSQSDTLKQDFYTRSDKKNPLSVEMMYNEEDYKYGDFPDLQASIVELPFLKSELSMFIILPHEIDGLFDVERRLKYHNFNDLISMMEEKALTIRIPKFAFEKELNMNESLEKLGIRTLFSDEAELDNMFTNKSKVGISKILHKTYISVNEAGVEAAAATFAQIIPLSLQPDMIYFTADHPFMFVIRSPDVVYFAGHVVDNFQ